LFHGAPQSLVTWNIIAPDLAKDYSIYMCDLRGYGDSSKPEGEADHSTYSKRPMALDGVEVMQHFGHRQFRMVGHDRGGRVGRRMALDHPDKVLKLAVLDIVPAHYLYSHVNIDFVRAYAHWFNYLLPGAEDNLLAQNQGGGGRGGAAKGAPAGAAKGAPKGDAKAKGKGAASPVQALVQAEYRRHNSNRAMLHAMCEDYRASASIDLKNDAADVAAGKKIQCPLLTLWAATGAMGRLYDVH
jgi:haloacetate dehalogenase